MGLNYIKLKPFSYDAAAALVRRYSGDERIMLNPQVQSIVFQLATVPGYLVAIVDSFRITENWARSLAIICDESSVREEANTMYALMTKLIACSVTQLPFPFDEDYPRPSDLEKCGLFWFRDPPSVPELVGADSAGDLVGVPFLALLSRAPLHGWNAYGSCEGLHFKSAFTETLSII